MTISRENFLNMRLRITCALLASGHYTDRDKNEEGEIGLPYVIRDVATGDIKKEMEEDKVPTWWFPAVDDANSIALRIVRDGGDEIERVQNKDAFV